MPAADLRSALALYGASTLFSAESDKRVVAHTPQVR